MLFWLWTKTLVRDDFRDHTPIYYHWTWLQHLQVLWIQHHLNPKSQRHVENYHLDGKFECDCYQNQQHKCNLDRRQRRPWNIQNIMLFFSFIGNIYDNSECVWQKKIGKRIVMKSNLGNLNWPSSEPSVPNVDKTRPLTSNTWIRWLFESDTITRFVFDTAM